MSDLQRKSIDCQYKALDDGSDPVGGFELYAAVFNVVDRQNDLIEPGAIINLPDFIRDGMGLLNHDLDGLPVAYIVDAQVDAKGLRIVGRYHSHPEAQKLRTVVRERLAAGKSVKCSFGFKTVEAVDDFHGGREFTRIKKMRAYEFSFVNLPANPLADVISAKSEAGLPPGAGDAAATPMSLLDSFLGLVGLQVKKGRAMSRANHAALKSYADQCGEQATNGRGHAKALRAAAKGLDDHADANQALADAMHKHLRTFDPEAEPDEAPAAPEADGRKSDADVDGVERQLLEMKAAHAKRTGGTLSTEDRMRLLAFRVEAEAPAAPEPETAA